MLEPEGRKTVVDSSILEANDADSSAGVDQDEEDGKCSAGVESMTYCKVK